MTLGLPAIVISYGVLVLMLLHQARPPALIGLLLAVWVAFLRRRPPTRWPKPPLLVAAICAPFAIWYLANALAPEVHADPNVYHLKPAMDALRNGGFHESVNFYNRLPQGIEMLFVPAFVLAGSSAAKLVHFAFLLATPPGIVHIARRLGLPEYVGPIAAAFYFITPVVGLVGTAAFNDVALVYFTLAAIAMALDDRPLLAGVFAGFCYAVKMTGLIAVPVAMAFFVGRRQWRQAALCGLAATLICSPWLIRNWIETGNPLAPFLNQSFPNPYFYVLTEQILTANLRNYGVSFLQRFPELLAGHRLQGIIGPAFLVAPIALLSLRQKSGRILLALAMALSASWWMNAGTRFLMPALPFLILAMILPLGPRLAVALLAFHAIMSWPQVVYAYSPQGLQLKTFPWRAALRLESESDYLNRESLDYRFVKMAEANTPRNARILDLLGAHAAHTDREFLGSWKSSEGVRLVEGLEFAREKGKPPLTSLLASFDETLICGFRVIQVGRAAKLWNLNSVTLRRRGVPIGDRRGWTASASTNRWDLPLAFDKNPVSRWSTWKTAEPGVFVQVGIANPVAADALAILYPAADLTTELRVEICDQGRWRRVPARPAEAPWLNLRPTAVELLKKAGITHILTPAAHEGIGLLGERLVNEAEDWNLEVVTNLYSVYLLKVR